MIRRRGGPEIPGAETEEVWGAETADAAPLPGDAHASRKLPDPLAIDSTIEARLRAAEPRLQLAESLRAMRLECGLSQSQVADAMGRRLSAIVRLESVNGPWPGHDLIAAYAAACKRRAILSFPKDDSL